MSVTSWHCWRYIRAVSALLSTSQGWVTQYAPRALLLYDIALKHYAHVYFTCSYQLFPYRKPYRSRLFGRSNKMINPEGDDPI